MIKKFFKRIIEFFVGPEQPEAYKLKSPFEPIKIESRKVTKQESDMAEAMLSDTDKKESK